MSYQDIYREKNEEVAERCELVMNRIAEIEKEEAAGEPYVSYFKKVSRFILLNREILKKEESGELDHRSLAECEEWNEKLYEDILPEHYEASYANPAYAVKTLGETFGGILSFLYAEIRAMIPYAFEGRKYNITILAELFCEVYGCFTDEEGVSEKTVEQAVYWFFHDYSEVFTEESVQGMVDPDLDFFTRIIMEKDLNDLTYLYRYGAYITKDELGIASYLNQMEESKIQAMADTYTEGYRIGFVLGGKDLSIKDTVCVEYPIGFERMVRAAIRNFEKMDLKPTIYREAVSSFTNRGNSKRGCYSVSPNKQYDYDHKSDRAFYLDKAFVERRLETLKTAYEAHKEQAYGHAGPAVIEVFGEAPFAPVNKKEAKQYSEKQNQLNVYHASQSGQITNQYIKGEERSFTIIAYPIPSIGDKFKEIFAETVKINTLDYKLYQEMQQKIIDVLNTGVKAHVKGKEGVNNTDLTVSLYPLKDPDKEAIFENCVADVNIPVGEVFTSPVLQGTDGVLHVTKVYLNGLQYKDLTITFKDGMIREYGCANFADEAENKAYVHENVLMHHETLPIGEFAIGTNTTAYRMARDYQIEDTLPILIAEKTGPHFALGDTCYSHAVDTQVFNPDGKEIVARDNEVSILRKEDPAKAYFNCHTDITIPYDELGTITVIRADGSTADIIRDGRFVVPGTEKLNEPL